MKKRFLFLVLALMLCLSVGATALAATRTARGNCAINNTGRNVSFSGYSESGQTEDWIGVTVTLWEQQGSLWVSIDSKSKELRNTDYVEAAGHKIVDGGHYYKVTALHTSTTNGSSSSYSSETAKKWIP
jgi:hypothetical protein